jgi:NADPH:quinone reductase-like Zn-dependent oxidoreductase
VKAVIFRAHGGLEVLEYKDLPTPEPGDGEVLVRLHAAALNHVDLTVRKGWPGLELELPHISGADGAGEVASVGTGVTKIKTGDHVVINPNLGCGKCDQCIAGKDNLCRQWRLLGETVRGTYAEFVALPERQLYRLPIDFDYHAAAAAALVYQTSWHSLITRGNLHPGETVLIVGAGGGVNTACIQVAKLAGARVIVVGSNSRKLELARSLGADILIDRAGREEWSSSVFAANSKQGVDVVVDNVGTTFMQSLRSLRKGGRLLTVGNSGGPRFEIDNRYLFGRHLSIIGSTMGPRQDFQTAMDLVVRGSLRAVIDRVYDLREAAAAQRRLEEGAELGKIVLEIG